MRQFAVRCERGDLPPPEKYLHKTGKESKGEEAPRGLRELRLLEHFGMQPSSHVLDVGCGHGRLAYECAWYLDDDATYTGLDISPKVIDWLNTNYAPRLTGFRFDFLDVYNEAYRPNGAVGPDKVQLPYDDAQFDVVCAFEVFMHVSLEGVRNYLHEMARVLCDGGLAVVTLVAAYPGEPVTYDDDYVEVGDGVYTARPGRVSSDMAFDIDVVRAALDDAGLDEAGSVKGRIHIPVARRPGRRGVKLPPLWHPCDVFAARKRMTGGPAAPPAGQDRPTPDRADTPGDADTLSGPTVPGPPTVENATAGDGSATISWTPPASDGGSPINGYAITASVLDGPANIRIFVSSATTQTMTDLRNGTEYRFWVRAYNAVGISAYSTASAPITPHA
jgi:SAM-dependent methyltransferase